MSERDGYAPPVQPSATPMGPKPKAVGAAPERAWWDGCWICSGCREYEFKWQPGYDGQVAAHDHVEAAPGMVDVIASVRITGLRHEKVAPYCAANVKRSVRLDRRIEPNTQEVYFAKTVLLPVGEHHAIFRLNAGEATLARSLEVGYKPSGIIQLEEVDIEGMSEDIRLLRVVTTHLKTVLRADLHGDIAASQQGAHPAVVGTTVNVVKVPEVTRPDMYILPDFLALETMASAQLPSVQIGITLGTS